jgi:hypothetical protein
MASDLAKQWGGVDSNHRPTDYEFPSLVPGAAPNSAVGTAWRNRGVRRRGAGYETRHARGGNTHLFPRSPGDRTLQTFASAAGSRNSGRSAAEALTADLGVALAEDHRQALYLRTFFDFCPVGCTRTLTNSPTYCLVGGMIRCPIARRHATRCWGSNGLLRSYSFDRRSAPSPAIQSIRLKTRRLSGPFQFARRASTGVALGLGAWAGSRWVATAGATRVVARASVFGARGCGCGSTGPKGAGTDHGNVLRFFGGTG